MSVRQVPLYLLLSSFFMGNSKSNGKQETQRSTASFWHGNFQDRDAAEEEGLQDSLGVLSLVMVHHSFLREQALSIIPAE